MKLVIDIHEKDYQSIKNGHIPFNIFNVIMNGTPLPKGHGRLIDVNQIVYEKECVYETDGCCTTRSTPDINATPTIIEADKESENE